MRCSVKALPHLPTSLANLPCLLLAGLPCILLHVNLPCLQTQIICPHHLPVSQLPTAVLHLSSSTNWYALSLKVQGMHTSL